MCGRKLPLSRPSAGPVAAGRFRNCVAIAVEFVAMSARPSTVLGPAASGADHIWGRVGGLCSPTAKCRGAVQC